MTRPLGWQDTLVLRAVARLALRHDLGTMTNWAPWTGASHDSGAEAIAVMAWSRLDVKPPNHHGCGLCWVSCVRYGQLEQPEELSERTKCTWRRMGLPTSGAAWMPKLSCAGSSRST